MAKSIPEWNLDNIKCQHMLVRKFITDTCSLIKQTDPDNVIYCMDTNSFRKQVSADYKASRTKPDNFYKVLGDIRTLLIHKGLNSISIEGLEADDLMQLFATKYDGDLTIIISADEDIRQLVSETCWVVNPQGKDKRIYSLKTDVPFTITGATVHIVDPELISATKILKGCDGDEVAPLAPKGFRTSKIKEIANEVFDKIRTSHATPAQAFYEAIKKHFPITKEEIVRQIELVYLHRRYLPTDLVDQFDNLKLRSNRMMDFTFNSILENTAYFDINYSKR